MTVDFLHILVTVVLAPALHHGMQDTGFMKAASKTKRIVVLSLMLYLVLFLLNLVWPYGSGLFL